MSDIYLSDLECPRPDFEMSQKETFEWLKRAYLHYQSEARHSESTYEKLLGRVGVSPEQIGRRGYFLKDFQNPDLLNGVIFQEKSFQGISSRQKEFLEITKNIFGRIYEKRRIPEHLLHVSCTGYVSPSAAQLLAAEKSPQTVVTHSYHMGCYGAFPALRMAQGFLQVARSRGESISADIVHTELCTLHLNPRDPTLEQILVQTLFADGAAAYRLSMERPELGFAVEHLSEILLPESEKAMSWDLTEIGFAMTLSKDVPSLIAQNIRTALEIWEGQSGMPLRSRLKDSIVAVHPGGPKIIDRVRENLELREDQVRFSRRILFEKGNMSSATIPHIWSEILKDSEVKSGTPVISMAFGPGLTVSLAAFRKL